MHPALLVAAGAAAIIGTGAVVAVKKAKIKPPAEKSKKGGKGPGAHAIPKTKPATPPPPMLVDRKRLADDPEYAQWYADRQAGNPVGLPPGYVATAPRVAPASPPATAPIPRYQPPAPPITITVTDTTPPRPVYSVPPTPSFVPPALVPRDDGSMVMPEMIITARPPALVPRDDASVDARVGF